MSSCAQFSVEKESVKFGPNKQLQRNGWAVRFWPTKQVGAGVTEDAVLVLVEGESDVLGEGVRL